MFNHSDEPLEPPQADPLYSADADRDADLLAAAEAAPDALDGVVEVAEMMAVFAAQRLVRIDRMRLDALAVPQRNGHGLDEVVERSLRLELAAALRVTEYAADVLIGQAEALVHRYPAVLASLARAGITERHAQVLVDIVDTVEPELRDGVAARALVLAETHPVGTFRRAVRKLVDTARYATLTQRYEEAVQTRRVVTDPAGDAMAWLSLLAPAVEVNAAYGRATAMAKVLAKQPGETRTLDQLRADVLCDLLIDGNTTTHPEQARGIRATVVATVPVLALLDQPPAGGETEPPSVEGVGPIPIDRAKQLCGGSEGWMRVLTHPETGAVLSVSRDAYRPPAALRKLVAWRADRCMAPGCGMPASRCEIDHRIPWEDGGETALWNLEPFCKNHHIVKHHGRWHVNPIDDTGGAIEWISPAGRRYIVHPERHVPVFRPADDPPPC